MPNSLPSYLHTYRRRNALTQEELGILFGLTSTVISKYESLTRTPSVDFIIGCEIVFGVKACELFPHLYTNIERAACARAEKLLERLVARQGAASAAKRDFIKSIITRLEREQTDV